MNPVVILALIASLQKEVTLLEMELAQQQQQAVVVQITPPMVTPSYVAPPTNPNTVTVYSLQSQYDSQCSSSATSLSEQGGIQGLKDNQQAQQCEALQEEIQDLQPTPPKMCEYIVPGRGGIELSCAEIQQCSMDYDCPIVPQQ